MRAWAQNSDEWRIPTADLGLDYRNTLKRMDEELQALYRQHKQISDAIRELEKRRTQHAAITAPIRRLPNEVLGMIFHFLGRHQAFGNSAPTRDIRLVCRRWNAVAVSTPQLWSRISFHRHDDPRPVWPREWMAAWVTRSKTLPLDISISSLMQWDLEALISSSQPLLRVVSRWRCASWYDVPASFLPRLFHPFMKPNLLQQLNVCTRPGGVTIEDVEKSRYSQSHLGVRFPALEDLFIAASTLRDIPRICAAKLTKLHLSGLYISHQDYGALSYDTPAVTSLNLSHVQFCNWLKTDLRDTQFCHTRLKDIRIRGGCRSIDPSSLSCFPGILYRILSSTQHLETVTLDLRTACPPLRSSLMLANPPKLAVGALDLIIENPRRELDDEIPLGATMVGYWLSTWFASATTFCVWYGDESFSEAGDLLWETRWLKSVSQAVSHFLIAKPEFTRTIQWYPEWLDAVGLVRLARKRIEQGCEDTTLELFSGWGAGLLIFSDQAFDIPKELQDALDVRAFCKVVEERLPEIWLESGRM